MGAVRTFALGLGEADALEELCEDLSRVPIARRVVSEDELQAAGVPAAAQQERGLRQRAQRGAERLLQLHPPNIPAQASPD